MRALRIHFASARCICSLCLIICCGLALAASGELERGDECAADVAVNLLQTKLDFQSVAKKVETKLPVRKYRIDPEVHWMDGSNVICAEVAGKDMTLLQTHNSTFSTSSRTHTVLQVLPMVIPLLGIALFITYREHSKASSREASPDLVAAANGTPESVEDFMAGPPLGDLFAAGSITALFEREVQKHPDDIAVVDVQTSATMSYAELDKKVGDLASSLHRAGLKEGDVVALLFQTSVPLMVAALAAMRAKVTWVPLDELAPAARLKLQIERCGARLGLAFEGSEAKDVIASLLPTYLLNSRGVVETGASHPALSPAVHRVPGEIAAMIFTSGSTGVPKAVMYGQNTFLHGVLSCVDLCRMNSSTRLLVKTPSVWAVIEYELFSAIVVGGTALIDPACQRNIQRLSRTVVEHKVTAIVTSAPVLQMMASDLQGQQHHLQDIINVGAAMPVDVCVDAVENLGTQVRVHNMYGCTETPCTQWTYSTTRNTSVALPKLAPAGRPQPGCDVYLLDGNLRPVPPGELGEICFGGEFLSPGYFQDLEQTTKRFIPNPHGKGKIYCSGDLGRFVLDPVSSSSSSPWVLQVEGRKDRQLNINGIRVAPEEVEAMISKAPGVVESAVVQAGDGDSAQMVACIAGEAQEAGVPLDKTVEEYCEENLAKHMRPGCILVFPKLPKLSNGKVDLKNLESNASAACQGASKKVVDSLGLMRSMSSADLQQKRVTDNLVAVSVVAMVFFHTCQTAGGCYDVYFHTHFGSVAKSDTLYWLLFAWRDSSEWSNYGFVIGGALMDAVDPNRFKIGVREIVILFSYLLGCGVHRKIAWEWGGSSFWYLFMLLYAKMVIVLAHRCKVPRLMQLCMFMSALTWGNIATQLDGICHDAVDVGIHEPNLFCEIQGTMFGLKSMLKMGKTCVYVMYGFTFLYGVDIVKGIRGLRRYAPSASLSLLLATCSFAVFAVVILFSSSLEVSQFYFKVFGRFVSVVQLTPLLVALLLLPEGWHMEHIARNALGSYVSSCIFYGTYYWKHQTYFWLNLGDHGDIRGSLMQFLGVAITVVVWVCVIGPGTQELLLAPVKAGMEAYDRLVPTRRRPSWKA